MLSRCRICGEAILGESPARCPYCAVSAANVVSPDAFTSHENDIQPTETERRHLEDLAEVARAIARTALGAARAESDDGQSGLYERLAWTHAEHVRVLCILASESHGPEWLTPMTVDDDPLKTRQGVEMRLAQASELYADAAEHATAQRVHEVFTALGDAESALLAVLHHSAGSVR